MNPSFRLGTSDPEKISCCMQEAAAQADFTIAVLSDNYLKSEYAQPEWAAAFVQDPTGKKRQLSTESKAPRNDLGASVSDDFRTNAQTRRKNL
jgi:hypothetical protein